MHVSISVFDRSLQLSISYLVSKLPAVVTGFPLPLYVGGTVSGTVVSWSDLQSPLSGESVQEAPSCT